LGNINTEQITICLTPLLKETIHAMATKQRTSRQWIYRDLLYDGLAHRYGVVVEPEDEIEATRECCWKGKKRPDHSEALTGKKYDISDPSTHPTSNPLCKCGCGQHVRYPENKYINGHQFRMGRVKEKEMKAAEESNDK